MKKSDEITGWFSGMEKALYFEHLQRTKNPIFQKRSAGWYLGRLESEVSELSAAYEDKDAGIVLDEMSDVLWMCLAVIDKFDQEGLIDREEVCHYLYNKHGERFGWLFSGDIRQNDGEDWEYLLKIKEQQKKRGVIEMPYKPEDY